MYYLQITLYTDFLIFIYVYFLMKIEIPWTSLNDSVFIIWVLSNRILGISWSSCCVNVDFPHIKEKLAAKHLFTQHQPPFLFQLCLQQGVRFDPDLPQTIRLEFAKSNTKVSKPKQIIPATIATSITQPQLVHPLTGRK